MNPEDWTRSGVRPFKLVAKLWKQMSGKFISAQMARKVCLRAENKFVQGCQQDEVLGRMYQNLTRE